MTQVERVLVVDNHQVFSDLLRLALDSSGEFECVASAGTVQDALATAEAVEFDIAIVDVQLPDGDGLTVAKELLALCPAPRVVLLTAFPRPDTATRAEKLGVSAMLAKDGSLPALIAALRTATPADPIIEPIAIPQHNLTPRELEVLGLLSAGKDPRTISRLLGISAHTSRDHVKSILAKLGASSQLDAVVSASRAGLVEIAQR